jgi:hypothetical protein
MRQETSHQPFCDTNIERHFDAAKTLFQKFALTLDHTNPWHHHRINRLQYLPRHAVEPVMHLLHDCRDSAGTHVRRTLLSRCNFYVLVCLNAFIPTDFEIR